MALQTDHLVGRIEELSSLDRVLAELDQGRSAAVLLVGEPGIGKTRLTVEAAARAGELGFVACWGRAWEAGAWPPSPVISRVRWLVSTQSP